MRRIGKADHRAVVLVLVGKLRDCGQAKGQGLIPQMIGASLLRHAFVMQYVASLLIVLPAQTEIEGEVVFDPPVILEVESGVIFLEAQDRLPVGNLGDEGRLIRHQIAETVVYKLAILLEEAIVGRALPVVTATKLDDMFAVNP